MRGLLGADELVRAAFFAVFSEFYLNQAQQILVKVLYALLRCRYPVSKRIVMSCALWASLSLTISIMGSSGIPFRWGMMLCHSAVLLALVLCYWITNRIFSVNRGRTPLVPAHPGHRPAALGQVRTG